MKEYFLIFIFSLVSCSIVCAQQSDLVILKGKIIDLDKQSIPFVSVAVLNDQSIGTYSNTQGRFEIRVPSHLVNDSLVFSCIGYENYSLRIQNTHDSLIVVLKPRIYTLSEVVIKYDSAVNLVKSAVKNLKNTLPSRKNILQGFYREIVRSDYTYDRLIEAAVDVFDKGYDPSSGSKNLQFKIRELRKSEDYMDLDWKASIMGYLFPKNGLNGKDADALFMNDYVRNNQDMFLELINAPLNDLFFEFAHLTIDSTVLFNGETFLCIVISPKDESKSFLPTGRIYVRARDLAIFQMDFTMRMNPNESGLRESLTVPGENFIFATSIKYKEYNGKMYLSFLYRKSFRMQMNYTVFNKTDGKKGVFYDEKFFITNEIITEKDKLSRFRKKEQQNKNIDLYSEKWKYNQSFWDNYNILSETPLQPNVKKDLERETSLKDQFKKDE